MHHKGNPVDALLAGDDRQDRKPAVGPTINDVILARAIPARAYDVNGGKPTNEVAGVNAACTPLSRGKRSSFQPAARSHPSISSLHLQK